MGLVGTDSAWIVRGSIISLLDSLDSSDISTMEGTLGIKTYYAKNTSSYTKFEKNFRTKFSEEDNSNPGIYALRAYDMMTIITQGIRSMTSDSTNTSLQVLLNTLLNNYTGLSWKMHFKRGEVMLYSPMFRIINIVDKKMDKELNSWSQVGFSKSPVSQVASVPKGWAMPTAEKKMKILVPGTASFDKYVKVDWSKQDSDMNKFDGFCIKLFEMIVQNLSYPLPYEMEAVNDSYDALIEWVHNKTYDAVIGDVTVLADRMDQVDFTQPCMESGLSMIVPDINEESILLFLKPFTWQMWLATSGMLLYRTLIVWFLESP